MLSPLQNVGVKMLNWIQVRPVITQPFGANYEIYKKFGHKGHNGLDLRARTPTQLFAPINGVVTVKDDGNQGYGLHIRIKNAHYEVVLAHLSKVSVSNDVMVQMGDKIGLTGNTGFSTAPHLHITVYKLKDGERQKQNNGYSGAIDPASLLITWKGSLNSFNI